MEGGQVAIAEGQSAALVANVLYATGAVLLGTGIVMWILDINDRPQEQSATTTQVVPMIGHGQWGLGIVTQY